jgi:hypothetical protein
MGDGEAVESPTEGCCRLETVLGLGVPIGGIWVMLNEGVDGELGIV